MKSKREVPPGAKGNDDRLFDLIVIFVALIFIYKAMLPFLLASRHFYFLYQSKILLCIEAGAILVALIGVAALWNWYLKLTWESSVTIKDESSVFLGTEKETNKEIHLKAEFRTMHAQVIGSTNAGKTASVILPWIASDIEKGRGCLIVDGKSERGLLDQIHAHAVKNGRKRDFMVFSLANAHISSTFNPFCHGSPEQITERVFSALPFENEYYRSIQFSALRSVIALLMRRGQAPMPGVIRELLRDKEKLQGWLDGLRDENIIRDILDLAKDDDDVFSEKYSGLVTALGHFSQGDTACLYNVKSPEIVLKEILKQRKICYFQLPTMQFPYLGMATGKLLLQTLQSTVSELQVSGETLSSLFSVYLDDFNDYIYQEFISSLNKSRSANVGFVFSHQSMGDLDKVGPHFAQSVGTNTNIKVYMRSGDPAGAEHAAKTIGTASTEKTTERRRKVFLGEEDTGEKSVREVEEYLYHPNVFKSKLGQGEGIVVIPHRRGRLVKHIQFHALPEIPRITIPIRDLPMLDLDRESTCQVTAQFKNTKTPSRKTKEKNQSDPVHCSKTGSSE